MTIYNVLAGPRNTSSGELLYAPSQRRTLMFIGDSITWGFGVTQNQAFPALVQAQADTRAGSTNTAMWTARNVQCDDIVVGRDTGPPWNVPFKLTNDTGSGSSLAFDNIGPFASTFSSTISATGPSMIFDGVNDGFTVSPSTACRYITVMVKVFGSGTATLSAFKTGGVQIFDVSGNNGNATVGSQNVVPTAPNVYRFIYDATTTSTAFLLRRTDSNTSVSMRILTVNPTDLYPTSNYVQAQINARGSYTMSDYTSNIASIMETVIHPQNEATSGYTNAFPAFVLSVGTVSMYFDPSLSASFDRRIAPSEYRGNLNALVNAIRAASPSSPIFLTHPPIATSPWVLTPGLTRSQYDAEIQSVAISQNLPVIDLRSALTAGDYSDGIHPTAAGQAKLAAVYNAALRL